MSMNPLIYSNDWRWNSQAPPPISGQIRTDTQNWTAAVTHLFVHNTTDGGVDAGSQLAGITPNTTLDLAMKTDTTRNVRFTATARSSVLAGYVDIPVVFVFSAGTIPNSGTLCTLSITPPTITTLTRTSTPVTVATSTSGGGGSGGTTITWKVLGINGRNNRFQFSVTCAHGSLLEYCATVSPNTPIPPMALIETTAMNLLRRTGCTCRGLVAGTTLDGEVDPGASGL